MRLVHNIQFNMANAWCQDYESNIHALIERIFSHYKCSIQPGTTVHAQNKLLCCGIIFTNFALGFSLKLIRVKLKQSLINILYNLNLVCRSSICSCRSKEYLVSGTLPIVYRQFVFHFLNSFPLDTGSLFTAPDRLPHGPS